MYTDMPMLEACAISPASLSEQPYWVLGRAILTGELPGMQYIF